jgi:hypothetical protein
LSYGFSVYSDSGEQLIRQDVLLPHYIGQASYVGPYVLIDADPSRTPYLEYRIASPSGAPLPFIRPHDSVHRFAVKLIEEVGAGQWRIIIVSTNTAAAAGPGGARLVAQVHCFSQLGAQAAKSAWGHRVLDEVGRVAFDSTAGPMRLDSTFSFPSDTSVGNTNPIPTKIAYLAEPAVPGVFGTASGHNFTAFWLWIGAYSWGFNGSISFRGAGATYKYGSPAVPIWTGTAQWRVNAHIGLVIDLSPYL